MNHAGATRGAHTPAHFPAPPHAPLDVLDAQAASDDPTAVAAWWITHQTIEHLYSSIARRDPATGESLPRSIVDVLGALRRAASEGTRPFPHDRLLDTVRFVAKPLAVLLDKHRHRIARLHVQLPIHQAREFDSRSVAWLARQAGRTVREKLGATNRILAVRRENSADTQENRLLRDLARLLLKRADQRLSFVHAYDAHPGDEERARVLSDCVKLCDQRMRRSDLADLAPLMRVQANNVLLSDPLYSRVFRAWKWLRDEEEALHATWPDVQRHALDLLAWMVAAALENDARVSMLDTPARVMTRLDGPHAFGLELLDSGPGGVQWRRNPPLTLLVHAPNDSAAARRLRLSVTGERLVVQVASLEGAALLHETRAFAIDLSIRFAADALAPRRGLVVRVEGDGMAADSHADLAGFTDLAARIAQHVLQRSELAAAPAKAPRRAAFAPVSDAALGIGIEMASVNLDDGQRVQTDVALWTLSADLPHDASGVEWLDGEATRELALGTPQRALWTTGHLFATDSAADTGTLALSASRMFHHLASSIRASDGMRAAYAVPDSIDELSQHNLRTAIGAALRNALPVWRSIAAATAWTASESSSANPPRPGETLVVIDVAFTDVTLTVLTACFDDRLKRKHPGSHGIYWERKPPLPSDEQLERLGWQNVLRACAERVVNEALADFPGHARAQIVDELLSTGAIKQLVGQGAPGLVQVASPSNAEPATVALHLDHSWLDAEVRNWAKRLDRCVRDALKDNVDAPKQLLVGAGTDATAGRFVLGDRASGTIKMFNAEKGFGFIRPRDGCEDVFFHQSSLRRQGGQNPQRDDEVAYEIGSGRGGRSEAKQVIALPALAAWANRPLVRAADLASGAREILLRQDSGCVTWQEWLPELSLEVVRDGHYGELALIESETKVDALFGATIEIDVPAALVLAPGNPWYAFPLRVGRKGRRPIAWEARLKSPAFPLDREIRSRLKLRYRYGVSNSYELAIEPESPDDAPFSRIVANWARGGEAAGVATSELHVTFPVKPWSTTHVSRFFTALKQLSRIDDDAVFNRVRGVVRDCWSDGRSLANAPDEVRLAFPDFRDTLERLIGDLAAINLPALPRALELLVYCHEDAPLALNETAVRLLAEADDSTKTSDYRKALSVLSPLIGDGSGERAYLVGGLLLRLQKYSAFDAFDPARVSATTHSLNEALWNHPALLGLIMAVDGAVAQILQQCYASLRNLLARVPDRVDSDDGREQIQRLYWNPFKTSCGLIMAMLRIDEADPLVSPLRCGARQAVEIAKVIRQLDARFGALGVSRHWGKLDALCPVDHLPSSLHRMSKVAFALNSRLTGETGASLVRIVSEEEAPA
ncbi:cold shock domain-containing protein [Burkholderia cepacia]|uniref:cold shock domain-containing protein n=1 Tax=Burkholderia cepacia TaxID=292 RepID=UPI0007C8324B|nr:cold shock domain-containing protein [Burkholderia cepacia]